MTSVFPVCDNKNEAVYIKQAKINIRMSTFIVNEHGLYLKDDYFCITSKHLKRFTNNRYRI